MPIFHEYDVVLAGFNLEFDVSYRTPRFDQYSDYEVSFTVGAVEQSNLVFNESLSSSFHQYLSSTPIGQIATSSIGQGFFADSDFLPSSEELRQGLSDMDVSNHPIFLGQVPYHFNNFDAAISIAAGVGSVNAYQQINLGMSGSMTFNTTYYDTVRDGITTTEGTYHGFGSLTVWHLVLRESGNSVRAGSYDQTPALVAETVSIVRPTTHYSTTGYLDGQLTGVHADTVPRSSLSFTFPDRVWLPIAASLFTPRSDRVDIAARLADFTAADMDALAGHDRVILPGAGAWETYTFADTFHGGRGNDTVTGRDGWDNVAGDAGNDSLSGRAGLDSLYGGAGRDRLDGGADSDALYGGDQADILQGGTGVDSLWGGAGDDFLYVGLAGAGVDGRETQGGHLLDGGAGNDRLDAWGADNALRDRLTGGAGADTFSVRGGDLITDFAQTDSISMLGARTTDWMSAVRDPDGTVTLRFHNNALRSVADLELDGGLAPRGFYATGSIGAWSVIGYQEPIAATRPEVLTLARALMKSLDNLQDDVLAEGFVFAQKALPGWAAKRWLKLEDTYMPELRRKLGDQAAEDLADYMNGKAGEFGQLMGELSQGTAKPKDAWDLLRDASVDVLKAAIPGDTFDLLIDLGVSGATIGAKVFERAVTLMTNSIRDDLLYQADLALQDRSLIILRDPDAGAPPAPGDLRLPAPLADDLAFL